MAPIKAVLRSKLDKADTSKSLQELLVDKFETLSDATSVVSSVDDQASSDSDADTSDYETLLRQRQEQQQQALSMTQFSPELLSMFHRPAYTGAFETAATASAIELPTDISMLHKMGLHYYGQFLYQQRMQQQQQQEQLRQQESTLTEEQPLNLTCQKAMKRPAPQCEDLKTEEQDNSEDVFGSTTTEAKRLCPDPDAAAAAAVVPTNQRKRKRSYRLSDNEEIRAYQYSAPELFIWNGHKPMIHQFLLKLLNNASCSSLIRWLDRDNRLFKVLQPVTVARLWQFIKGNRTDNYECFARGIRHSRDIGKYFEAHEFRKKKVYKFSEKALKPEGAQASNRLAGPSPSARDAKPPQHEATICKSEPSVVQRDNSNVDVLAKLKIALAERMQQQQQQQHLKHQQQQQQQKLPLRQVSVKEEPSCDDSPLIIADCDHL